jgi:8-oxo-dGTP pyrophosphatase MutT (NUDIX family)
MGIAIAVNICLFNDKDEFLVLKKANSHQLWGPPGGRVEEGEDIWQAAKRELWEETGIQQVEFGNIFSVWYGFVEDTHLHVIEICARTSETKVTISHEDTDYSWWSFSDLLINLNQTYVKPNYMAKGYSMLHINLEKTIYVQNSNLLRELEPILKEKYDITHQQAAQICIKSIGIIESNQLNTDITIITKDNISQYKESVKLNSRFIIDESLPIRVIENLLQDISMLYKG